MTTAAAAKAIAPGTTVHVTVSGVASTGVVVANQLVDAKGLPVFKGGEPFHTVQVNGKNYLIRSSEVTV